MFRLTITLTFFCYFISSSIYAKTIEELTQECIFSTIKTADKNQTLQQIEDFCQKKVLESELGNKEIGALSKRIMQERRSEFSPFVITPHKMNYILPASYTNKKNTEAYSELSDWAENFKNVEAKFQISMKVPLTTSGIFKKGDHLYFAFTLESWWQLYAEDVSRPFRETNYQPEFFYITPIDWHPFGGNAGLVVGVEHQSNGRSQLLSRSWNRAYLNFIFEKNDFALSFRPWYRIPEDEKENLLDPNGDDNPDIDNYMGHFELGLVYSLNKRYDFSLKLRENFAHHKGAIELGFTFPLWGKLKGYAQYFNGYGESLIDYNHKQQRFGIGFALTDIL